jgi:hypothetical protein
VTATQSKAGRRHLGGRFGVTVPIPEGHLPGEGAEPNPARDSDGAKARVSPALQHPSRATKHGSCASACAMEDTLELRNKGRVFRFYGYRAPRGHVSGKPPSFPMAYDLSSSNGQDSASPTHPLGGAILTGLGTWRRSPTSLGLASSCSPVRAAPVHTSTRAE